jgi:hypothetical protein
VSRSPSRSRKSTTTSKVFTKKESTASTTIKRGAAAAVAAKRRSERESSTASTASTTTRGSRKKSTSKPRALEVDTDNAQTRYSLRRRTPAPTPVSTGVSSRSTSTAAKKKCPISFFNNFSRFGLPCIFSAFKCPFAKCHGFGSGSKTVNSGYIRCTQCRFIQICIVTILLVALLALINYFHLIDALEYKNIKESISSCYSTCTVKASDAVAACQEKSRAVVESITGLFKRALPAATSNSGQS